jgi:chemotaxis protein CheZ
MPSKEMLLDDAHGYLQKIIDSLRTLDREEKGPLIAVLEHLSHYVQSTRRDIAALRVADDSEDSFVTAASELEEIVAESAKATDDIIAAAESIEQVAAGRDRATAKTLNDAATRIYVSCAFQDITGQRIAKVLHALQRIEMGVAELAQACSGELGSRSAAGAEAKPKALSLEGPPRGGQSSRQEDIDRLFGVS